MRIAVTGGAGFIGANLTAHLLRSGTADEVVVVDDLSTGSKDNLAGLDGVRLVEGTILDASLLDDAFAGAAAVVHLAARPSVPRSIEDPIATHEANATGTLQVLEAARRAGGLHTVLSSSSSVYGANPTLPKSENLRVQPMSPYAVSKLAAEQYALSHANCFDLPVLPFRFFNVFGPLQPAGHAYAAVVPAFIDAALSGQRIPVHGDGTQTRDFTFVRTVAQVLTDAVLRRVTSPEPVNLAYGSRRSLREVIQLIEDLLDAELERDHQPPRPGDVPHSQADATQLHYLFPDVDPTPFDEGLRTTIDWFRTL